MRLIFAITISFLLGIVLIFKGFQYLSVASYSSVIEINRDHDIKIYRDKFGIPHIQAQTLQDSLYAQGFVQAQDRLWQLHLRKLASQGKLSELFGERTLKIDQYFRSIDYLDSAKRITEQMNEQQKELYQAFVDGINQGRKSLSLLPIEFQLMNTNFIEWSIFDLVALIKFISFTMMHDYHYEMMRSSIYQYDIETIKKLTGIGPQNLFDIETTTISDEELRNQTKLFSDEIKKINNQSDIPKADLLQQYDFLMENIIPKSAGSNSWAIHGNFTKTGYPLLASDPHLENGLPCQWYQSYTQFSNGDFISGGSIVGIPFPLSGRTRTFSWGITLLYSDASDFYEEQLKEINGKIHYLYKDNWYPTQEKNELIYYEDKIYNMTIHRTHHGPILNFYFDDRGTKTIKSPEKYYSLKSIIDFDDLDSGMAFFKFIQGNDLQTSLEQLKKIYYPHLGMIFASQKDIAYMPIGKLIIRSGNPETFGFIKNGTSGETEWLGFISEEEHPIIINPTKGFVSTANNRFFPNSEKYQTNWNINPTGRAHRIHEFLSENVPKKITLEQMKQLQLDTTDSYAKYGWKYFKQLINSQQFKDIIDTWDFKLTKESTQATLYMLFDYYYAKTFIDLPIRWSQTYNFDSFFFLEIQNFTENAQYCKPINCKQLLNKAIDQALQHYQTLQDKQWGANHKKYLGHSTFKGKFYGIFDREISFGGNRRTPSVSTIDMSAFPFIGWAGANYRMIVSMRPGDVGEFIIDGGVSGNPLSDHYDDQLFLYSQGLYIQMYQKQFDKLTLLKKKNSQEEL